jgi:hypothetical protein
MAASSAGDIKKAKDAGYHTCQGLMMHTKKVVFMRVIYLACRTSYIPL